MSDEPQANRPKSYMTYEKASLVAMVVIVLMSIVIEFWWSRSRAPLVSADVAPSGPAGGRSPTAPGNSKG